MILAIDQGTSNTKAIVVDRSGTIIARAAVPMEISFPQPGWVEQDPLAIWQAVQQVVADCLAQVAPAKPTALGISNQRETILAWHRQTGQPLGPAIIWQCRRTADFCQQLREQGQEPMLRRKTGLTIDALFSASKARWLLAHNAAVERKNVCLGTVDSWLVWCLTKGKKHVTDYSNASRTQLLNLQDLQWDDSLLQLFGIDREMLPEIHHSAEIVAETEAIGALPAGIPIASLIGDSHAALFGQRGFVPGTIKATFGTGSSLMTALTTPTISERGISTTVAWAAPQVVYAMEGNISVTGSAVQWFGQFLNAAKPAETVAELARGVNDTEGVYVVPAFVGLGAPHWNEQARGLICGMTRGTEAKHVARAVLDSIAYQIRDVFDAMQADVPLKFTALLADGGATRNDDLMQFVADILQCTVVRNASLEVSPLGAAYLAGIASGLWSGIEEIGQLPYQVKNYEPSMPAARCQELYAGWKRAIARAIE